MAAQRLDKIIASTGRWSRREVKDLVRQGRVTVDDVPTRRSCSTTPCLTKTLPAIWPSARHIPSALKAASP